MGTNEIKWQRLGVLMVIWMVFAWTLAAACDQRRPSPITAQEVSGPLAWGSADNVMQLRRLWFSEQPDEAGLAAAREAGVTVVLDLREPDEFEWDEPAAAARVGIEYKNIAVPGPGPFPRAAFSEIEAFVKSHPDDQILIHCASGNRAAGWLATHLVEVHGVPFAEALAVGRRVGMTSPAIAQKVADYLGEALSEKEE